ncbi:hypothetical protein NDU88_008043 [Pleurodeles waltl]|uniref:Uncharacterized protein n=1 Tax=Pleurodeles waltl TaxID=8319 RepID=A0AAV7NUT2_PLEWA|nr:hypothetical protein NDU88_008043 [Pleurodeles waltl]
MAGCFCHEAQLFQCLPDRFLNLSGLPGKSQLWIGLAACILCRPAGIIVVYVSAVPPDSMGPFGCCSRGTQPTAVAGHYGANTCWWFTRRAQPFCYNMGRLEASGAITAESRPQSKQLAAMEDRVSGMGHPILRLLGLGTAISLLTD